MTDEVWKRDEVESPCNAICLIHPEARLCIGCYRTADEIERWSKMNSEERRRLLAELPERAHLVAKRRGGRAAASKRKR